MIDFNCMTGKQRHSPRQQLMFDGKNFCSQRFGRIVRIDCNPFLQHDRSCIVFVCDKMNRRPGFLLAGGDDGFVNMMTVHSLSSEFWQEGRMDIHDPIPVPAYDSRIQFFHVSGEHDQIDMIRCERRENFTDELIVCRKVFLTEMHCGNLHGPRQRQCARIRIITDDDDNRGIDTLFGEYAVECFKI